MHYLITGHTGFIGRWLSAFLRARGDVVSGISLGGDGSEREIAGQARNDEYDAFFDLARWGETERVVREVNPDFVFHLAAQRLVGAGYADPIGTYATNVIGTANILEAVNFEGSNCKGVVVATTDKVYKNDGSAVRNFVEGDPLGAQDPMSASKACADLIAQSAAFRADYKVPVAIARLANVVGAFDAGEGLLITDILNGFRERGEATLRMPGAVRPWTSVIDVVRGLGRLGDWLSYGCTKNHPVTSEAPNNSAGVPPREGNCASDAQPASKIPSGSAFNFGPQERNIVAVSQMAQALAEAWEAQTGEAVRWVDGSEGAKLQEAANLGLDSAKAQEELGWVAELGISEIARLIVEGEAADDVEAEMRRQLSL